MLIGRPFQQVIRPGEILDRKDNDRKDCRSRHSRSLTVAGLHLPRYPSKRSGVFLHRSPHHGMTTVSPAEWHKRYGTRDKSQDLSPSRMWPPPNPIPGKKRCLVPDQCHSKNQGYLVLFSSYCTLKSSIAGALRCPGFTRMQKRTAQSVPCTVMQNATTKIIRESGGCSCRRGRSPYR